MREIAVAVVQMAPKLAEPEHNLVRMSEMVEKICLSEPVDLIVFPELCTSGYECGVRFTDLAELVPSHSVGLLGKRAREFSTHILFGLPTKEKVESILYNGAVLIGPEGEMLLEYRKVHLKGEEKLAFRPGFRYITLETTFGALGVLVGWDIAFPETARSLVLDGAELVCVCANWEEPARDEWYTYLKARAYENAVYVVAANRIGQEYTYTFLGHSAVIGPRGELLTAIDEPIEGYAIARIDLDAVRKAREESQLLQSRQPHTYRAVVRKY
jgi:predicted amidohydrolase